MTSLKGISINNLQHLLLLLHDLDISCLYPFLILLFIILELTYFLNNEISLNQRHSFATFLLYLFYLLNGKKINLVILIRIVFRRSWGWIHLFLFKKIYLFFWYYVYGVKIFRFICYFNFLKSRLMNVLFSSYLIINLKIAFFFIFVYI